MNLTDYSTSELLAEIVRREGRASAPTRQARNRRHSETLVAIGKDYTASIIMENDAALELEKES